MKNKPFFSIITCTLNSGEYLGRNIKSLNFQTFKNYEQIFIDGYSKDNTLTLIKKEQIKRRTPVILKRQKPKGISAAFNEGIKNSHGEYLFFLNSDDWLVNKYVLGKVYKFLKKNNYPEWIYGKIKVIDEKCKKIGIFPEWKVFQKPRFFFLKFINYVPHQSVFMKRKIFKNFGNFDQSLASSMDYDLYLRIINKTGCLFSNITVANYFVHQNSATSSINNRDRNLKLMEKVQSRYLSFPWLIITRLFNQLVERYNKIYKIQ